MAGVQSTIILPATKELLFAEEEEDLDYLSDHLLLLSDEDCGLYDDLVGEDLEELPPLASGADITPEPAVVPSLPAPSLVVPHQEDRRRSETPPKRHHHHYHPEERRRRSPEAVKRRRPNPVWSTRRPDTRSEDRREGSSRRRIRDRRNRPQKKERNTSGRRLFLNAKDHTRTSGDTISYQWLHRPNRMVRHKDSKKEVTYDSFWTEFLTANPSTSRDAVTKCALPLMMAFSRGWTSEDPTLGQRMAEFFLTQYA